MSSERHVIEPITTSRWLRLLEDAQLTTLREASLDILENVGVRFHSEKALAIFAEHGASVDRNSQIVKIPRDLVLDAMSTVPRFFIRAMALSFSMAWSFGTDPCSRASER
jgi:trimethylamine:corrinoid methyltransferase-like protein